MSRYVITEPLLKMGYNGLIDQKVGRNPAMLLQLKSNSLLQFPLLTKFSITAATVYTYSIYCKV